jgi:general secretion pathway protein G
VACCCGLTLIELVIAMAILATLAAIAIPLYVDFTERARVIKAVADIRILEGEIAAFETATGRLPTSLDEIARGTLLDPWGTSYQYLSFATLGRHGRGQMRKDRFLVPLNSTYDLYANGKDGRTQPPLTAPVSWDDVVRANDGGYLGLASNY